MGPRGEGLYSEGKERIENSAGSFSGRTGSSRVEPAEGDAWIDSRVHPCGRAEGREGYE